MQSEKEKEVALFRFFRNKIIDDSEEDDADDDSRSDNVQTKLTVAANDQHKTIVEENILKPFRAYQEVELDELAQMIVDERFYRLLPASEQRGPDETELNIRLAIVSLLNFYPSGRKARVEFRKNEWTVEQDAWLLEVPKKKRATSWDNVKCQWDKRFGFNTEEQKTEALATDTVDPKLRKANQLLERIRTLNKAAGTSAGSK
jgi:hypothetical protein